MNQLLRLFALSTVVFCSGAYAQVVTIPITCTGITNTVQVPAPGSGSLTISNLTKYNVPAQVCTGGAYNSANGYSYSYYAALTFNNVTSTCAGTTWRVNGGPVHVYFTGTGTASFTGSSISGQGYYQYDNLTVTVNNVNYQVSSGIVQGRYQYTSSGTAVQTTFFVPSGGIPMTVNGQPFSVTADLYRCLNSDANLTIVQE